MNVMINTVEGEMTINKRLKNMLLTVKKWAL